MADPLDYARPDSSPKTLALPAMICGLISGPVGYILALIVVNNHLPESAKEALGLLALCGSMGGAFIFSIVVMRRLPKPPRPKDRLFSVVGAVASVGWVLAICAFIAYAISQV
jgi:hypothetical protein